MENRSLVILFLKKIGMNIVSNKTLSISKAFKVILKIILPRQVGAILYSKYSQLFKVIYLKYDNEDFKKPIFLSDRASFYGNCEVESGVKVNGSASFNDVSIGKYSYFAGDSYFFNCKIGRFCSIGHGVTIGLHSHPSKEFVSTHPSFYSMTGQSQIIFADHDLYAGTAETKIGNDVWIGQNVLVKAGISIGDGAIIGAGAVVTKNVLPYEIVGGVPAKEIRSRFIKKHVDFLVKFQWWNKDEAWIRKNWRLFSSIEIFIEKFDKENVN